MSVSSAVPAARAGSSGPVASAMRVNISLTCQSASRDIVCPIARTCDTSSSARISPSAISESQARSAAMSPSVNTLTPSSTLANPSASQNPPAPVEAHPRGRGHLGPGVPARAAQQRLLELLLPEPGSCDPGRG